MATYELYLGGAGRTNPGYSMFPAPTFSASAEPFTTMRPAAHKGPKLFSLNRVLDFTEDTALVNWVAEHEAGTPVAQGDVLGILVIPQDTLLLGIGYNLERPSSATTTTLTPAFRGDGTNTLPAITASGSAKKGFAIPTDAAWQTTFSEVSSGGFYVPTPLILQLTLTTLPAAKFGDMRLTMTALLCDLHSGQY